MPLVIQFTGPYAAPKILCDHCGEEITEAKDGNYQWRALLQEDGACMPMVFTHKRCCAASSAPRRTARVASDSPSSACPITWRRTST